MRRKGSALGDDVAKGLPWDELHHHERVRSVAAFVEDRHDIGMDDRRGASGLFGEARPERLIRAAAKDLHRDVAIEPLVPRAPDLAGAAFVDALLEPVAFGENALGARLRAVLDGHTLACPQVSSQTRVPRATRAERVRRGRLRR